MTCRFIRKGDHNLCYGAGVDDLSDTRRRHDESEQNTADVIAASRRKLNRSHEILRETGRLVPDDLRR